MNRFVVATLAAALTMGMSTCEDDGLLRAGPPHDIAYTGTGTTNTPTNPNAAPGAYACDLRERDGRCIDYAGDGWDAESAMGECLQNNGEFLVDTWCPIGNRLGTCSYSPDTPDQIDVNFYLDTFAPADEQDRARTCELEGGRWVSGAGFP